MLLLGHNPYFPHRTQDQSQAFFLYSGAGLVEGLVLT